MRTTSNYPCGTHNPQNEGRDTEHQCPVCLHLWMISPERYEYLNTPEDPIKDWHYYEGLFLVRYWTENFFSHGS